MNECFFLKINFFILWNICWFVLVGGLIYGFWLDWLRRLIIVIGDFILGVKFFLFLLLIKD